MSVDKSQLELFRNFFALAFVNPDWYLVHPLHKGSQEKCWILRTFLSMLQIKWRVRYTHYC